MSRAQELTAQVVSFLEARNGAAPTTDVVDHFQPRVPAAQMPLFRQLLKQVCVCPVLTVVHVVEASSHACTLAVLYHTCPTSKCPDA